jgi:hypothetical protein
VGHARDDLQAFELCLRPPLAVTRVRNRPRAARLYLRRGALRVSCWATASSSCESRGGPPDGTNNCRLGDRDHSSTGPGRRPRTNGSREHDPAGPVAKRVGGNDLAPGCRINAGTVADQADQPCCS